jgi:hypothetical protein
MTPMRHAPPTDGPERWTYGGQPVQSSVADQAVRRAATLERGRTGRRPAGASPSFESQYGLLRDNYAAKPAFAVFAHLVSALGAP